MKIAEEEVLWDTYLPEIKQKNFFSPNMGSYFIENCHYIWICMNLTIQDFVYL